MWYWNQENFEGLTDIADLAAEHDRLSHFADYCRYRERGLRKESFRALDLFIEAVLTWPEQEQRRLVDWLCRLQRHSPQIHQLIPHPLMNRLILPVLRSWVAAEPKDATPHRWLGFATRDRTHFRDAIALDDNDELSRVALVEELVGDIEHSCHHLPAFFIGSPDEMLECADEGAKLLAKVQDTHAKKRLSTELDCARQQTRDWIDFQSSGEGSFDDWCARRGQKYVRPITIWYGDTQQSEGVANANDSTRPPKAVLDDRSDHR